MSKSSFTSIVKKTHTPAVVSKKQAAQMENFKNEIDSMSSIEQGQPDPSEVDLTDQDLGAAQKEIELQRKYGSNEIEAGLEGAARGVIPGFDYLATKLGVDPERLREVKERNSISAGVGEAAGLVGGALASGGENVLAKATVGGLTSSVEKKIATEIGEGIFKTAADKSIARKIAEKSLEQASAAGLSGAGLGANTLVNEAALGNADLTGENLVAYAGAGAVLNGLVGGAFGAADALSPVAKQAVDRATGQLKQVFKKELDFDRNLAELASNTTAGRRDIYNELTGFPQEVKNKYISDVWNLKYTDTPEAMLEKHLRAGEQLGESIASNYKKIDQIAPRGVVPTSETHLELNNSLLDFVKQKQNLFDNTASKNVVRQVQNELENRLKRVGTGKFESAEGFLDAIRTWGKKGFDETDTLKADLYKQLNRKGRELLFENAERVTAGTPLEGVANNIRELNKNFQVYYSINKGLHNKAASDPGFLGLKDSAMGLLGGVAAGPMGVVGGALSAKAWNSDLRRKFVVLNTAERANAMAVRKVSESVKNFFEKTGRGALQIARTAPKVALVTSGFSVGDKRKKPENELEAFKNIQSNLTNFKVNPDKLAMKIAAGTMKAGYAAPNAAKFAQLVLGRAVSFLYDKMPKDNQAGLNPLQDREFQPSSMELAKFKRYVQTVENPYTVLEDLKAGTLTQEHVEALKTVYPAVYQQIQSEAMKYVAQKPKLDYSRKVQLGVLLNIPTDPSLQPKAIAALQMNFVAKHEENKNTAVNSTVGGISKIDKSNRMQTPMQKAAGGIEE